MIGDGKIVFKKFEKLTVTYACMNQPTIQRFKEKTFSSLLKKAICC
jgi:hypothetical protein